MPTLSCSCLSGLFVQDLNYPSDLGKDIYSKVMNTGARIMSESWGGEPQG